MNGKPHLHLVEVRQRSIQYGDTNVSMFNYFGRTPTIKRVKRKITKTIRKHDKGSLKAVEREAQILELTKPVNEQIKRRAFIVDPGSGKHVTNEEDPTRYHDLRSRGYYATSIQEIAPAVWGSDLLKPV